MKKFCKVCGEQIPEGRVKALPHTKTCTAHSTTERFGYNIVQHGDFEDDCWQEVEVIRDPQTMAELREYKKQQGTYK